MQPDTELAQRVRKLEKDMYFGDGAQNPSVTNRLTRNEDTIAKVEDSVDKISTNIGRLAWLVFSGVILAGLNLIMHH